MKPAQRSLAAWLLIAVSVGLYASVRAPSPSVNEPHYLCKAKHYWDRQWCAGDLFLESSNPHLAFYWVVGPPTRFLSLDTVAVASRVAIWLLLALAWLRLAQTLGLNGRQSVFSVGAFLSIAAVGNLSGEWLVGGVESKVLSYALLLLAGGYVLMSIDPTGQMQPSHHSVMAAALAGTAFSFHPVVGGWAVIAAGLGVTVVAFVERTWTSAHWRTVVRNGWRATIVFCACALPGLLASWSVLTSSPDESRRAADIQVWDRLAHHLNPMRFSVWSYLLYGALLLGWLWLSHINRDRPHRRALRRFVWGSIIIAMVGFAVGCTGRWPDALGLANWQTFLLKFYPFRLVDVVLPLALSLELAAAVCRPVAKPDGSASQAVWRQACVVGIPWLLVGLGFFSALNNPPVDRSPSRLPADQLRDWLRCCRWIGDNTPPTAHVLTPRGSWAFKWFAERAEYVAHKDCPQDARALIEWDRRRKLGRSWRAKLRSAPTASADIWRDEGVSHVVVRGWHNPPPDLRRLIRFGKYTVYRVPVDGGG